jgi:HlyD family secretion protein
MGLRRYAVPTAPRRSRSLLIAAIALLTLALAACGGGSATPESGPSTATVTRGTFSITVTAAGSVAAAQVEALRFGVAGTVMEVLASEGAVVAEGDVLARLDATSLTASRDQADAALANAQVALDALVNPTEEATAQAALDLESATLAQTATERSQRKAVDAAQTAQDNAAEAYAYVFRRNYGIEPSGTDLLTLTPDQVLAAYPKDPTVLYAWTTLFPALPPNEDEFTTAANTAHVAVQDAVLAFRQATTAQAQALATAQRDVEKAQAAVDALVNPDRLTLLQAQAAVTAAQGRLADAQLALDRAVLTADFAGTITDLAIGVGDDVTATANVATLSSTGELVVEGQVDEIDIAQLAEGQQVRVELDALQGVTLAGTLLTISSSPVTQQGIVSYPITIALTIPRAGATGLRVLPGMTATATVVVAEQADVLLVPAGAIQRDGQNRVADVLLADGTTQRTQVTISASDGRVVVVSNGLSEGDEVVVPAGTATTVNQFTTFGPGGLDGGLTFPGTGTGPTRNADGTITLPNGSVVTPGQGGFGGRGGNGGGGRNGNGGGQ